MREYTYDISIVIVNYNVEFFLEQCLNSVNRAIKGLQVQIFVVDNHSIDESVRMVEEKFPHIHLIANKENVGFSRANNQAIALSDARYILLLNPDTVIEEDTLHKIIRYMDEHPEAGGMGVRMLDGKGRFLPESKRGLPTPSVAFYKVFGLSQLFPRSKTFGQYHAGHIGELETHEVDVLSGAFMLLRASVIEEIGALDETFFMYGEDIDLSYRIQKSGFKNIYFPETSIIHYKGESTKKSSVNYVIVFYRAMIIFANKHFSQNNAKLVSFSIHAAIYFRAFLAISARFIRKGTLILADVGILYLGMVLLTNRWRMEDIHFPLTAYYVLLPSYIGIWMLSTLYSGGYDQPPKITRFATSILTGTFMILIIYALLPKDWQFSRLYILAGACWTWSYYTFSRLFLHTAIGGRFGLKPQKRSRFAIVGSPEEYKRVREILQQTHDSIDFCDRVATDESDKLSNLGHVEQLDQIVHIHNIHEIIFCAKDTTAQSIIFWMSHLESSKATFKIAQPDSLSLIGSNSIETAGDLYVVELNNIQRPVNRRNKRTFDILSGMILLTLTPAIIWIYRNKRQFTRNILNIIIGKFSMVGYDGNFKNQMRLPAIKKGVLHPSDVLPNPDDQIRDKLNLIYVRNYSLIQDIGIVSKSFRSLDRIM